MKKLLSFALICISVVAIAAEKNTTTERNSLDNIVVSSQKVEEGIEFYGNGCRHFANRVYDELREEGYTHRQARKERRIAVRQCRSMN
ncbi:MAG: hypothetical protein OIF50_15105 [Flavobacteriaceae bacterium]|nr:hypothetical protein [Flavobacteriaceae bacterium]